MFFRENLLEIRKPVVSYAKKMAATQNRCRKQVDKDRDDAERQTKVNRQLIFRMRCGLLG